VIKIEKILIEGKASQISVFSLDVGELETFVSPMTEKRK
jgi:hypothetical protein